MKISVPKEIKNNENRIAIIPAGVVNIVKNGHDVLIEKGAGLGSGFTDQEDLKSLTFRPPVRFLKKKY